MRADRDDAPNYLNRSSLDKIKSWIIPGIFGCAVTSGVLYFGGSSLGFDIPRFSANANAVSQQDMREQELLAWKEQERTWTQADQDRADQQQREIQEQFWKDANAKEQKQTVFNDNNYAPLKPANTYTPPPVAQTSYSQPSRQRTQTVRQSHSARWEWESGSGKRLYGTFEWVDVNDSIEWGSVCRNYRSGSIEYRDCRKGAKVAFKSMCGRYRPACMAENGYRP